MKKNFSLLLMLTLVLNMGLVFADTTAVGANLAPSKGLSIQFQVDGVADSHVKSGLIKASLSLYDKNKNLIKTQSLSPEMFDYEYQVYNMLFNVTTKANDVFYLSVDSKSVYVGPINVGVVGEVSLKQLTKLVIEPFFSDPEGNDVMQFMGNAANPFILTTTLVQNSTEFLVPVTVNGVPTQGVEFVVYGTDGKEVTVAPTDSSGFLRIPYSTPLDYSINLKGGQYGYIDPETVYFIYPATYGTLPVIALLKETLPVAVQDKSGDFENFKTVNTYSANTFTDFSSNDWFSPFVKYAYETGIITGKSTGKFDPKGNLTVAEAITLAAKVHKVFYGETPTFEASKTANWYDGITSYAVKEGMISANEFTGKYNQNATRGQMVYIFSKALPTSAFENINTSFDIPDVDSRTDYNDKIQMFYDAGVLSGADQVGSFHPDTNVSRAEAATIINKVIKPSARKIREEAVK